MPHRSPVLVGGDIPFFPRRERRVDLELVETRTFSSSIFPTEGGGEYHLFACSNQGGGGIRPTQPPEVPGSIPYVHVEDCQAAFDRAIEAGGEGLVAPTRVMEGVTTAIVLAPGGVPIGFSGP